MNHKFREVGVTKKEGQCCKQNPAFKYSLKTHQIQLQVQGANILSISENLRNF